MTKLKLSAAIALTAITMVLTGCGSSKSGPSMSSSGLSLDAIEAAGDTKVSQVDVQVKSDGLVQFSAGGKSGTHDGPIFDAIYCRAYQYRMANGYDGYELQAMRNVRNGGDVSPQIWTLIMQFHKKPFPEGKKIVDTDDCKNLPKDRL